MLRRMVVCAALLITALDLVVGDISQFLKDGDAAFSRGEFNAALKAYSNAIEVDSKTALLYTKRAAAYISLRQASQALRDLNKAIEAEPTHTQAYIHRGKLHRQMCNTGLAEKDFQKVLEIKPGHKSATKELGVVLEVQNFLAQLEQFMNAKDVQLARNVLQHLYDKAQDCVKAQLIEAQLYGISEDWEQVVAVTGRLLKSDPANLEALLLRGKGYFYSGDHDLAKRHYGEALKYDPDYKSARTEFNKVKEFDRKKQRAMNALQEQSWEDAENAFAAALNVDANHRKGNLPLWQGIGEARFHQRKWESAEEAFTAVRSLDPGNEEAVRWLIKVLMEQEKWQEAVNKAREAVSQNQQSHELRQLLADCERRLKMSQRKDYYKILGVNKDATDREIKRAYRDLAKVYHPDKVTGSEEEKKSAEQRFRDVAEAYEVLSDEEKRQRYDSGADLEEQQGGGGWHHGGHPFFHQQHGGFHQQFHFQWG